MAPEFCSVYTISKGKLSSIRSASIPVPNPPPRQLQNQSTTNSVLPDARLMQGNGVRGVAPDKSAVAPRTLAEDIESIKSPFTRGKAQNWTYGDLSMPDTDISFVSSSRSSTDRLFPSLPEIQDMGFAPRLSNGSETENRLSFGSPFSGSRTPETNSSSSIYSSSTQENGSTSWSSSGQNQVEVLSSIRHPNMVLLLGACPEYGCLVYEYMANGSLDDRLFRRGNSPVLPWQLRFRIAAEIGTGLLFLHQTKPEPLVHRDLKPANILLDRNYVSKIGDVGLARLVPPSVADSVTQYLMTSTAGTFCYIDPEYQQTGMLGIKSDIYSLGVMLLQIITAKPPMGLTHQVERAIEKGKFADMLDPAVPDWPVEEALNLIG